MLWCFHHSLASHSFFIFIDIVDFLLKKDISIIIIPMFLNGKESSRVTYCTKKKKNRKKLKYLGQLCFNGKCCQQPMGERVFSTSKYLHLSQGRMLKQEFGGYLHICLHSVFFTTPVFQSMPQIQNQTKCCVQMRKSDKARGHTTHTEDTKAGAKLCNLPLYGGL